jgi:3-deoxy-D-manno-octulosonate 8-phosphate phosphatase (KDO 8-P phosphatase)
MLVYDPELINRARAIRMLVLDVDGVLTDGRLYFDNNGNETKAFNTRDGLGMKALQRSGIEVAVITGRESAIVTQRMKQLDIKHVYQGREDKLNAFNHLLEATAMQAQEVCFAGDDWIDLPVLIRAGLAVTVADADEHVKQHAHWITERKGGEGAVREICNLILAAQGKDTVILDGFLAS